MSGIYLHIPFCKQDCHYCNFYFTLSRERENDFTDALCREIELSAASWPYPKIETLYFGGGTPSLLSNESFQKIISQLKTSFDLTHLRECTLEVNPDDMHDERAAMWKEAGVNRLSIGVQSFSDCHLKYMNRAHDGQQAIASINTALRVGIVSLNVDLIYGVPGMTDKEWSDNIHQAAALGVNHLSCYALTVEEGTRLAQKIQKGRSAPVSEEDAARHFEILTDLAPGLGFVPYEISNLARPGHEAVHNQNYWLYKPYLGLGPSAHSFDGITRGQNAANLKKYIDHLKMDTRPVEQETLSNNEQYNEYVMIRLRTRFGCSIQEIEFRFGKKYRDHFETVLQESESDFFQVQENIVSLTNRGRLLADRITVDFLMT